MAGIYVHVPFCSQACHYCDFHFSTSLKNIQSVVDCIKKELTLQKNYLSDNKVNTIYFGGGTPSLLHQEHILDIITVIKNNFKLAKELEFTIELKLEDVSLDRLENWHKCGINRISIGVQSFIDRDLKFMNRSHTQKQSIVALQLIKQSSIKNINADLMYGYPLLSSKNWEKNLKKLIQFKIQHISCYCLTVEKKTALFHFIQNKQCAPLDPEQGVKHFLIARDILTGSGYKHYEISNYALPDYQSLHNKNYWNKTPYLGVGPSAHSYNGKSRQWNVRNNTVYCSKINKNELFYDIEILTNKDIINEYILTNLRTFNGLDLNYISDCINLNEYLQFTNELNKLEASGFLTTKDNVTHLNDKGMLFADSISSQLFLI